MAEGILAVQEERVRVGGVNLTKKTVIAATDEGVVAVAVHSVEPTPGFGYGASGYPPIRIQPMPALPASVMYTDRVDSQPMPALPAPVMYTDGAKKNCCERGWCECDPDYNWYNINGKGWGVVLILLLVYLVLGVIGIAIFLCLCVFVYYCGYECKDE